jgi:hypothetical protein
LNVGDRGGGVESKWESDVVHLEEGRRLEDVAQLLGNWIRDDRSERTNNTIVLAMV